MTAVVNAKMDFEYQLFWMCEILVKGKEGPSFCKCKAQWNYVFFLFVNFMISSSDQPGKHVLLGIWSRQRLGEVKTTVQRGGKNEQKRWTLTTRTWRWNERTEQHWRPLLMERNSVVAWNAFSSPAWVPVDWGYTTNSRSLFQTDDRAWWGLDPQKGLLKYGLHLKKKSAIFIIKFVQNIHFFQTESRCEYWHNSILNVLTNRNKHAVIP